MSHLTVTSLSFATQVIAAWCFGLNRDGDALHGSVRLNVARCIRVEIPSIGM